MDFPAEYVKDKIALVNSLRLPKTAVVRYGNVSFKYTELDAILDAIKCTEFGKRFCVTFDCSCDVQDEKVIISVTAILMHISGVVERSTPAKWILPAVVVGKPLRQQEQGAAITFCKRYAIAAMLGVSADEDTDCNTDQEPERIVQAKQQTQAKRQTAPKQQAKAATPAQAAPIQAPMTAAQQEEMGLIKGQCLDLGITQEELFANIKRSFNGAYPWSSGQMSAITAAELIEVMRKMRDAALQEIGTQEMEAPEEEPPFDV